MEKDLEKLKINKLCFCNINFGDFKRAEAHVYFQSHKLFFSLKHYFTKASNGVFYSNIIYKERKKEERAKKEGKNRGEGNL